jgi:hypothetical protein
MNGVRIGNGRWDPWIRTVTHYYNGCAPSFSCFSQRYAHYRDNTSGVYREMGADPGVPRLGGGWMQTFARARSFRCRPARRPRGTQMRNTGMQVWHPGAVFSALPSRATRRARRGLDWVSDYRAATIEHDVAPGETGRFVPRAPDVPGEYSSSSVCRRRRRGSRLAENILQVRPSRRRPRPALTDWAERGRAKAAIGALRGRDGLPRDATSAASPGPTPTARRRKKVDAESCRPRRRRLFSLAAGGSRPAEDAAFRNGSPRPWFLLSLLALLAPLRARARVRRAR